MGKGCYAIMLKNCYAIMQVVQVTMGFQRSAVSLLVFTVIAIPLFKLKSGRSNLPHQV